MFTATSIDLPSRSSAASSACACTSVRGKPSSTKPWSGFNSSRRAMNISITRSSGTSSPFCMYPSAITPKVVPLRTCSRSMSPVEMCAQPMRSEIIAACVPLPTPGGPKKITYTSADKSFVVAHQQLRFELFHRVEHDADDDEHARAADREGRDVEPVRH